MSGKVREKKGVGRPRSEDPYVKFDLRLRLSIHSEIDQICEKQRKKPYEFVRDAIEKEIKSFKNGQK